MSHPLNKEQKAAVTYDKGPLLVSAGPGSGKTRVIAERVKFLIEKKKLKQTQILCLTFGNAGAEAMRARLEEMKVDTTDLQISTYHSFCNNILRDYSINSAVAAGRIVKRSSFLVWGLENIDSFGFDEWLDLTKISSVSRTAVLIEKLIGAKTREELTTTIHALDRVLLWGHYVIPLHHSGIDRIAYWNFLEFPDTIPLYGIVIESWWSNLEKAQKLKRQ